jgi:hypothetical protein
MDRLDKDNLGSEVCEKHGAKRASEYDRQSDNPYTF